ncbi:hypothetical protein ACWDZ4_31775 [Streptomyces sp. NPDC003016]
MWPGQQPPGGEQNPQDQQHQNPYRQPGYQQPGYQPPAYRQPGHQQPGYQQPNPYQQPTAAPPYAPSVPPGGPQPPDGNRKKTTLVAIAAATAVVAAAVITGAVVLGKDDEDGGTRADGKKASSPSATSEAPSTPAPPASPPENPRGGSVEKTKPTIPGWKVVSNPKHGTRFDVPPEWEVQAPGITLSISDTEDPAGKPLIGMSAPAYFKNGWCGKNTFLGAAGTRGANGARTTSTEAEAVADNWVFAAYDQKETGTFKVSRATPFTSASGLKGSVSVASVTGVAKKDKCDTDGKSIAFAFKDADGDFAVWSLYTSKGVDGELPDATVRRILGTVRLIEP